MKLFVSAGPDKGRSFTVPLGAPFQVGRSQAAALRLSDPHVSRVHFEVEWEGEQAVLHDCSTTGTLINGAPVQSQPLHAGDVIRIGGTELLYSPAAPAASPPPAEAAPTLEVKSPEELVGQTMHHFAVDALLARGLTGHVFRARDLHDDRVVALKILRPELAGDDEQMQRFVRAMKTMLPIRHPNIVTILAAGRTGPYCFVSMDLVEGDSLGQAVQKLGVSGKLPWQQAQRTMSDIAKALAHAHGRSILHRNVTPSNILLRSADQVALLGDLMLAKALEGSLAQQITRRGALLGDIAYLAPERTIDAQADQRADLYGLGATIYSALTGRALFTATSLPELVHKIRAVEPDKPRRFQPGIPASFEAVVLRLLAKRPEDRYPSAAELLAELERIGGT
jgi:serine/threonine protein kinase